MDDAGQDDRRPALSGRRHLSVVLVLSVGLLLTLALFQSMRIQERSLLEAELNLRASKYAALLQSGIDLNLGVVRAVGALYEASDFVARREFTLFI